LLHSKSDIFIVVCPEIDASGCYWSLSPSLPEDKEIRIAIRKEKLVILLTGNSYKNPNF